MAEVSARFTGFPPEALAFYEELEVNNNRTFFQAHKATFEAACREPMRALLAELEPEFGEGRLHRPNRDIRFTPDRSPYRTDCSAFTGGGNYVSVSTRGLFGGGGRHDFDTSTLARYREAVASEVTGPELMAIVDELRTTSSDVDGMALKTAPRGYASDHPRIEFLRFKQLHAGRHFEPAPWLHTPEALERIRGVLRDIQPLLRWLDRNVGY